MKERNTLYAIIITNIKTMTDDQLIEFFYDFENDEAVQRIVDAGLCYLENRPCESVLETTEKSYDEENKQVDDLQRYRDIKSTDGRPF